MTFSGLMSSPSTRPAHRLLTSPATDRTTRSIKTSSISSRLQFAHTSSIRRSTCWRRQYSRNLESTGDTDFIDYRVGIVPSNKTTYKLSQFQNALKSQTGALPFLGCGHNGTVLQEVWYFQHVYGTVSTTRCSHNSEEY